MSQNSTFAPSADLPLPGRATTFYGITEPEPGREWRGLFDATWPAYRRWYLREGDQARPSLETARARLSHHMPELVPTWERLSELTGHDETASRMLTQWNPPRYLPGCSQLVQVDSSPVLVRNYDYHPDLCERVVYSSNFTGRRVIGSSDCLWGLIDGMNDAGLAVSLTYAGEPVVGDGFGIPVVVRYLLEVAETIADVSRLLRGLLVSMAYNLTVLDRNADVATFFVTPGQEVEHSRNVVATNHRGTVPSQPAYARRFRSVERPEALLDLLDQHLDFDTLVQRFLKPPLYNTTYDQGFGTMYTAAYRPTEGFVDYAWPNSTWRRDFDSPSGTVVASLGQHQPLIQPAPSTGLWGGLARTRARYDSHMSAGGKDPAGEPVSDPLVLAAAADAALIELAASSDPAAFSELLRLSSRVGECLGLSARRLAEQHSWALVAQNAGTSRQAAWERWRG